jgi:DNA-binding GntR family transcriptional regulator
MNGKLEIVLLRDRAADVLRREIFEGTLLPGMELTQEELAGRLGISRMPVREALQILERDGLIRWASGNRAVVCGWTLDDLRDHYEIRALIEGEAAARAAVRPETHAGITRAFELADGLARAGSDPAAYGRGSEEFHRAVWSAAGSSRIVKIASQLFTGLPPHLHELVPGTVLPSTHAHRTILEGILSGSAEAARRHMAEHILASFPKMRSYFARIHKLETA